MVEVKSESSQGAHSAPFPRALVEFFVKAFSDAGDSVFDPFMGSGTTLAAAHVLGRTGYGCEISPGYCDVILRRMASFAGEEPVLAETGEQDGRRSRQARCADRAGRHLKSFLIHAGFSSMVRRTTTGAVWLPNQYQ